MSTTIADRLDRTSRHRKWILVLVLVAGIPGAFAQQSGCGTNPFQDWYWVDWNNPFPIVGGTISRPIKLNAGGLWDDGDWNIFVAPDDTSMLRNSSGDINAGGDMEWEVMTRGMPSDLAQYFPVGTRVEGCGEWVEDGGHDNKTELHPLNWMRTLDRNPVAIFVAQDDTGRFVDAQGGVCEQFQFVTPASYLPVTPGAIPPSATEIFHESARIAGGTTKASISPTAGYVLWIFLDSRWFSECENVNRVISGDSPYYFGTIERSTAPLLRETVGYSVATDVDTAQKIAILKVKAALDAPPQGTLVSSKWAYESSAGAVVGIVEEKRNQPPHEVVFSMPYAPALGYNQSRWILDVSASTEPYGTEVPSRSTDITENIERTYVTERRTYVLNKSEISLTRTEKGGGVCLDSVYLTVDQSKLLPQIRLRNIRWFVKVLRDADGYTVSNPVEVLLTPQNLLDYVGFSAQAYKATASDPDRDKRCDVFWKKLSSGQSNLSRITVTARGVTELGEEVEAAEVLSALCGFASFSYSQIMDYSYRIMAAKGWEGELYKVIKNVSGSDKAWLEALGRFHNGEVLSESEKSLILSKAMEGSKLPELPARNKPVKHDKILSLRPSPSPIIVPPSKTK